MARQQKRYVAPPLDTDKESLNDFASVVQDNLLDIYSIAHVHDVKDVVPTESEGNVGDIILVNLSGIHYLYCKVDATTWKRTAALS